MDEVRRAEDPVRPIGHDAERLWSIDVLPLGDGGRCIAGARRLVNAVAPPWRCQEGMGGDRGKNYGWCYDTSCGSIGANKIISAIASVSSLRDDAGSQAADVRDGGLGDGQDGAGTLWRHVGEGAIHLLLSLGGAPSLPVTVGVVLDGELQQSACFLDQQVDLERKMVFKWIMRQKTLSI